MATRIPLRGRDGSVRASVLVDEGDAAWLNQWRWSYCSGGYARRMTHVDKRPYQIKMHRQILGLERGDGLMGDHINRDRLDNRRENLRIVTAKENAQNRVHPGGASAFRGVQWHKPTQTWRAVVKVDGRPRYLGRYVDELEAARVARDARIELFGRVAA